MQKKLGIILYKFYLHNPIPKMCFYCIIKLLFCSSYLLDLNYLFSYFLQITDRDPVSKYICRKCYEQVEENYKFVIMCQTNNAKKMENETNEMVKTKYKKFMRLPFIDLVISN